MRAVARALDRSVDSFVDLSISMNPFAPDVMAFVRSVDSAAVTEYPDSVGAERILARNIGVDPDRLVLTNGGAEAIALVAAVEKTGHIVDPEFSLYRRHLDDVSAGSGRWRSNPSNPLGVLAPTHESAQVWDEAFFPLATGRWTRGDESSWRLGSLTKLWSCPGLRLGYAIAPTAEAAHQLRQRQPRWAVNGIALSVLEPLLAVTNQAAWCEELRNLRSELAADLRLLGYHVVDTEANWLLVSSPDLRRRLIRHGVLVRDCTSFGLSGTFRVGLPRVDRLPQVRSAFERCAQ